MCVLGGKLRAGDHCHHSQQLLRLGPNPTEPRGVVPKGLRLLNELDYGFLVKGKECNASNRQVKALHPIKMTSSMQGCRYSNDKQVFQ